MAFEIASRNLEDIPGETRRAMRDRMTEANLLQRCVRDISSLLKGDADETEAEQSWPDADVVMLWDGSGGAVAGGVAYDGGGEPQGTEYW